MRRLLHERHLASQDMGLLHVISEEIVSDTVLDALEHAAMKLYYQYEVGGTKGTSLCIQCLKDYDEVVESGLAVEETYESVYLVNPIDLINFFYYHPECANEVYLMSDSLHGGFHDLLRSEEANLFDGLIQSTFENHGLMYGVIFKS